MGLMGVDRAETPPKWINGGFDRGGGGDMGLMGDYRVKDPQK